MLKKKNFNVNYQIKFIIILNYIINIILVKNNYKIIKKKFNKLFKNRKN